MPRDLALLRPEPAVEELTHEVWAFFLRLATATYSHWQYGTRLLSVSQADLPETNPPQFGLHQAMHRS